MAIGVTRLAQRVERFLRTEASSGVVLFVAGALALAWANSGWAPLYTKVWRGSLAWLVNDVLMAVFFFVAGLEIRRELHSGALSSRRAASLPVLAALGGMIAPALLYGTLARAPAVRAGWGVPMATDIAFAVGLLTLLGRRVPRPLRVLLLTLAVADDLGAILVIAAFYSAPQSIAGILAAALAFAAIFGLQRLGVRAKLAYAAPAVVAWAGIYRAGIHPTIAGVLLGLVTPTGPGSVGEELVDRLHPWVAFGVMPLFALANAGVSLDASLLEGPARTVAGAVVVGLVAGKPIGVLAATLGSVHLRIAALPEGIGVRHLVVLGIVAGVGFTMSLFVAQLAFQDAGLLEAAKAGVLGASGLSAILAVVVGRALLRTPDR
jgi:NhaA family Na+:H+ antiporter